MLFLGGIFYIGLLLINAVAVLSEDRFLARSARMVNIQPPNNIGFQQNYDQSGGYGNPVQDIGMKGRLINLISAVRTVMRIPLIAINIVVIIYELILGK
ncbi:Yos1-like protein [Lactifluus volemus]|nr:Yos1-like protein [Lactifluus volemus]